MSVRQLYTQKHTHIYMMKYLINAKKNKKEKKNEFFYSKNYLNEMKKKNL